MGKQKTLEEIRVAITTPIPAREDGGYSGEHEIDVVKSAWDRWHKMGYQDLAALLDYLSKSLENEGLLLSRTEQTPTGILRKAQRIDKEFHQDEWKGVRFRLKIQVWTVRTMLGMIYTDGWPLPSWDDLGEGTRKEIEKSAKRGYKGDEYLKIAHEILSGNKKIDSFKLFYLEAENHKWAKHHQGGPDKFGNALVETLRKHIKWSGFKEFKKVVTEENTKIPK